MYKNEWERGSPWNIPWDIEKGAEDQGGAMTTAEVRAKRVDIRLNIRREFISKESMRN